jgi:hypothetical protein
LCPLNETLRETETEKLSKNRKRNVKGGENEKLRKFNFARFFFGPTSGAGRTETETLRKIENEKLSENRKRKVKGGEKRKVKERPKTKS